MYIVQLLGVGDISTESEVPASVSVSTISTTPGFMFNTTLTDPTTDSNMFLLYSNMITFTFNIIVLHNWKYPYCNFKIFQIVLSRNLPKRLMFQSHMNFTSMMHINARTNVRSGMNARIFSLNWNGEERRKIVGWNKRMRKRKQNTTVASSLVKNSAMVW